MQPLLHLLDLFPVTRVSDGVFRFQRVCGIVIEFSAYDLPGVELHGGVESPYPFDITVPPVPYGIALDFLPVCLHERIVLDFCLRVIHQPDKAGPVEALRNHQARQFAQCREHIHELGHCTALHSFFCIRGGNHQDRPGRGFEVRELAPQPVVAQMVAVVPPYDYYGVLCQSVVLERVQDFAYLRICIGRTCIVAVYELPLDIFVKFLARHETVEGRDVRVGLDFIGIVVCAQDRVR